MKVQAKVDKLKKAATNKKTQLKPAYTNKWAFFIFIFAFALYSNTLKNDYALDDDIVVLKNTDVQAGLKGVKSILSHSFIYGFTGHNDQSYRPLVLITYALEKEFFGNNPGVSHSINVLLFALSCTLLYYLLCVLFPAHNYPTISVYFFITAALLFAAHPIHTEAVANIKGRDDIMNFIFFELALLFSLKYIDEKRIKLICFSAGFLFLALLCKEIAVTFIAAIPLTLFFFRPASFKTILSAVVSFVGVLAIYLFIRSAILDTVTFEEKMLVINNSLAAATNEADRIATAIFILGKYLSLLFFPYPLSWDYSFNQLPIVSFSSIEAIGTLAIFAGIAGYALWVARQQFKSKKNPTELLTRNIFAYSILFFLIAMSVVSNIFILIGSTLGERFLLTPSFAFCLSLASILFIGFGSFRLNNQLKWGIVSVLLILFSFKTINRNKEWKNNHTLFTSGAEASPNSSRAQSALGTVYREQAEQEKDLTKKGNLYLQAIQQYNKAIAILPENTDALYNVGVCYYAIGERVKALASYKQTLTISPTHINAANNLGVIYFEDKDYKTAQNYFELAVKYAPSNADALANLGAISHNTGDLKTAIEYYKRALAINPNNSTAKKNLNIAEGLLKK